MIYKCKNCGAALRYDMKIGKMLCESCLSMFDIEEDAEIQLEEIEFERETYDTMESKVYHCSSCGAKLMFHSDETASFCAFCGQPTVVFDRVMNVRKPEMMQPFRVPKEVACALIQEKLKGKFIPSSIKKITPDVVRGIYVPFSIADFTYEGKRCLKGTVQNNLGNYVDHYFYQHATASYSLFPTDMSTRLSSDASRRLEPFPIECYVPFDPSYLVGFYADCGDASDGRINEERKKRAEELFDKEAIRHVRECTPSVVSRKGQVTMIKNRYALIPVWFYACRRKNKTYTLMVNGVTGKVVGAMPLDVKKVVIKAVFWGGLMSFGCASLLGKLFQKLAMRDGPLLTISFIFVGLIAMVALVIAEEAVKSFKKSRKLTGSSSVYKMTIDRQGE